MNFTYLLSFQPDFRYFRSNRISVPFISLSPSLKVPVSPVQRNVAELKQITQQLQSVHPNVFAKALSRSILYQDQNLIAINKPYGVPVYSK